MKRKGQDTFSAQCYIKGEPQNERDFVLRGVKDEKARKSLIVDFAPLESSRTGELAAKFDIVLGYTPAA